MVRGRMAAGTGYGNGRVRTIAVKIVVRRFPMPSERYRCECGARLFVISGVYDEATYLTIAALYECKWCGEEWQRTFGNEKNKLERLP